MSRLRAPLLWSGPLIPPWFAACALCIASLRPDYDHATKAISELGAINAPYSLWMNLLGFATTGTLIGIFAIGCRGLPKYLVPDYRLILATAVFFALTAVPVSMDEGEPDYRAVSTQLHVLFVLLVPVPWCWALSNLIAAAYRAAEYLIAAVSLICLVGFSVFAIANFLGVAPNMPGLLQRISFAIFLSWFGAIGWIIIQMDVYQSPRRARQP